ncbi:head-tail connector protein [Lactobacillus selangorensis]|uniref:head-tail connector protein n=1 Tax=Lactobacillus selangorensis TaxID=81857 RepID=UPI00070A6108|nr:head-tail connector protein [Lactobacillus selangorensis]
MTATLDDLKNSLRLDSEADDKLLTGFLSAAQSWIKNAVGTDDVEFYARPNVSDLYDTATLAIASAYYERRSAATPSVSNQVNLVSNSIIGQLRGEYSRVQREKSEQDG